ncbi:ABC transporter permease [Halorubellus litoreus]|uniref:ABC transporter permease n=1 Tax=Halorubellus litoreus TaxID=755308 RepID=A0ABD5VBB7_9EURY
MSRWSYFARRLILAVPVVLFGTTLTFMIIYLGPIDPVSAIVGPQGPTQAYEQIEAQLGLNKPLFGQYIDFLVDLAMFNLGESWVIQPDTKAMELIGSFAPRTLWLGFWSVLLPLFVGIPLGFYAGLNPNTWSDYLASLGGIVWRSMPNFWLGVILLAGLSQDNVLLGFNWKTFIVDTGVIGAPPLDFYNVEGVTRIKVGGSTLFRLPFKFKFETFLEAIKRILPPAVVLGSASMGNEMRLGRTAVLETVNSNYVETARAKGLSNGKIVWKHVFRNALIPLVPIILNEAFLLIGGSVILETIFGINGLGWLFFQAVTNADLPLAGSLMYIFILIIVFLNILQDFLYTIIDPRVGYDK